MLFLLLQVEHSVTESCCNVDLVEMMVRLEYDCLPAKVSQWNYILQGHAIQTRIYAEDPVKNFQPAPGILTSLNIEQCQGTRVDLGVYEGAEISPLYDPMILKIIQWAPTRSECIDSLLKVLTQSQIAGPPNNVSYILQLLATDRFRQADLTTAMLHDFTYSAHCFEVLSPGMMTTVQDWPGRIHQGLWRVGVPPSGAMDHLACRLGNKLVGNEETDAVLEICITGPTLKFHCHSVLALTGALMEVTVNGDTKQPWVSFEVSAGSVVTVRPSTQLTQGCRAYLSVQGGINVPQYLGSRATFTSSQFGGYQGRVLKVGDMLPIGMSKPAVNANCTLHDSLIPNYTNHWQIGVLPGPYADPDYFTKEDIAMVYSAQWKVHHDSNRLGVRLIGPAPTWSRLSGGEGGSHPSNVHDYVYGIGSVNFTGNMPIIITHDGPSLGGFVCPITITQSELWKVGQLRPADTIQFVAMNIDQANEARMSQNYCISTLQPVSGTVNVMDKWGPRPTSAVLFTKLASDTHPGFQIRLIGDIYIMIEYGPMELDLNLRFRVHFLEKELLSRRIVGLTETAPGVRQLQVKYDPLRINLAKLVNMLCLVDDQLPDVVREDLFIESRVLFLPLCFNHSGVDMAIDRYKRTVRCQAPYLPSNIDFIAKNNGLDSSEDVYSKVLSASYMCLGLGDVYLGAPCAVPTNPLHRLVNPKYNPARTFTQEGTVGLGGAYMCIYPMDSPGGYQLVGRSLPIWNTYGRCNAQHLFSKDKPWLLDMFDQIRFYSVTEEELEELRGQFRHGQLELKLDREQFSIRAYNEYLIQNRDEIVEYQTRQRGASEHMNMEEHYSLAKMQDDKVMPPNETSEYQNDTANSGQLSQTDTKGLTEGHTAVSADLTGMVGEITVRMGAMVHTGDALLVICAMKMEYTMYSPIDGTVHSISVCNGDMVTTGQHIMTIKMT